jgi:hypothetical protein
MPSKPTASKPAPRHPYGPREIAALLPGVTRPAFRAAGAALGPLLADWPAIVGPDLAAVTTPRRFAAGTLTLGCAGPVAVELQHLAEQLLQRINTHLGGGAVKRLRFVQQAPSIAAPPPPRRPDAPPVEIEGMEDGPLRAALAALGAAVRADGA